MSREWLNRVRYKQRRHICNHVVTVGAKKKFPYSTVLLPYLTVLLPFFNRTYALLPAYFRRTLIVLLPHPLTYFNRTTSVLSPSRDTTVTLSLQENDGKGSPG